MPPLPPVASCVKTQLYWDNGASKNASSHLYWHFTGGAPSTTDLAAFANLVGTQWGSHMVAQTPNNVTLKEVIAEDLSPGANVPGVATMSTPGTYPTTAMTAETAVLINLTVARRYRGGKPRLYLPGGVSAQLNNQVSWQGTFVSAYRAAFNSFLSGILAGVTPPPAVDYLSTVSYHSGGALRGTPLQEKVLDWEVNAIPGSQRRRMGR